MTAPRARDLGIRIGLLPPGPLNAITDVAGVRVGHTTLISGDGPLVVGQGPIRTGVTVILPGGEPFAESFMAGCHRLNGNGELTGLEWVRESGMLTTPIAITNTHSVGVVRDALISAAIARGPRDGEWSLPVVGETYDGRLNDMDGQHVRPEHVAAALDAASDGPVPEGNVGGGTGMICHEFKGGIGTASRVVAAEDGGWTVGVLVQANYGLRERLTLGGIPVGRAIPTTEVPSAWDDPMAPAEGAARCRWRGAARRCSRCGFHHRHHRHRRAAPPPPVRAAGAARRPGDRACRWVRRSLERRPLPLLRDREPDADRHR